MAWQDVPEGTTLPVLHCIESGHEYSTGQVAGYAIHLAQEVDAAQLVLTIAKLWDIPGVTTVSIDTPDAQHLSILIAATANSRQVLREVREAFESETSFTGAMLIRGCGCARCKAEAVVWLAVNVIDDFTKDERQQVVDALRSHNEVLSVATRDETLILKVKLTLLDSEKGDAARMRALLSKAGIHLETPRSAGYVLRLTSWVASRNSPHDW